MNSLNNIIKKWHEFSISSSKTIICKVLAYFNGKTFEDYYFEKDYIFNDVELVFLENVLKRLKQDEPLSKILGVSSFYGRNFIINEHVLDPRPDSECLIDAILTYYKEHKFETVLDLGTGSGCLIISLLLEISNLRAVGVDFSQEALDVAQENAQKFGVHESLQLLKSNWFSHLSKRQFDCVISNPPYIASGYKLDPSVLNYDPHSALFSGHDGLRDYRLIFKDLPRFLKSGGFFFGEIGFDQKEIIKKELENYPQLMFIDCMKDLANHDRIVIIKKI